jgi:hypothetical protein
MMEYYSTQPAFQQQAQQPAPQPPQQQQNEWNIDLTGRGSAQASTPVPPVVEETPTLRFTLVHGDFDVQEAGNKEARLGDTLYFVNPTAGTMFKKYVDYSTGQMIVETAQFARTPSEPVQSEPSHELLALAEQLNALQLEVADLKGAILSVND